MEPQIVKLSEAVKAHGEEISELTLRPPRARDLRVLDDPNLGHHGKSLALISRLADIPISSAEQLSIQDYDQVSKVIDVFFEVPGLLERSEE